MAEPIELKESHNQLQVRNLEETGFIIPPGWYGFVAAAGSGIIHRSRIEIEDGMNGLERLCSEDPESRTPDFGGRRMARIDGGYIILNFIKYRERDHTSAERSRRYRLRKLQNHAVTDNINAVASRDITQAEAEAEADKKEEGFEQTKLKVKDNFKFKVPTALEVESYAKSINFNLDGEYFLDYQCLRSWKLKGGVPIKDWKAVVRTWKKNQFTGTMKPHMLPSKPITSASEALKSIQ